MLEKIQTKNLQEGMYIVCSANGYPGIPHDLANKYILTKDSILTLLRCDIREVLIDSSKSTVADSFPQTSYSEEILFARETYTKTLKLIQNIFETIENGGDLDIEQYGNNINPLLDSLERNSSATASLTILARTNKYIFTHSLNTAILSAILGRFMGLSRESIKDLTISAMLMNVGTIWIPGDILNKKGKLTQQEFSEIKKHPVVACNYLKKQENISIDIIRAVLSHHERDDCSGYPEGLSGNEIPQYSRIISICDSYDAMTSERPYRDAMDPNMAIKHLYSMKNTAFHPRYLESFIKCIGIYPVGCFVKLSDGRYGVVMNNTPQAPLLPQIKIVFDSRFRATHPEYVDLSQRTSGSKGSNLEIVECIHPKSFKLELNRFLW
ncbi:HD-GYP domain-containing protein [Maridesulfovibrio ferrireducens]|nr:HD-GYP domain-containing protein [Maridesulfovibrio ferrireducens]